ncbi:MAG: IclR family transcriptional regulator [Candidatus Adiutrix sp.]|jgi:DNA-binding IclR family transcriptional regulator|nr:IclR family transcriptional regulator [Candidatus Adiutrix sp.]
MTERAQAGNSINKALDIIEDLSENGPSSLTDINARLGLDKGTLHRILKTLRERGFVEQNRADRRYFNTIRMFQIGSREVERGGLRTLARPYLEKLAAAFGETIHVAILVEPGKGVCVDKMEAAPGPQVRLNMSLGSEISLYASSMGKCLLAFSSEERLAKILPKIKYQKLSPSTIRGPAAFKKELARVRKQGYALDDGETLESIFCVGVPVLNHLAEAYAALSVTGPRTRMLSKKDELIQMLKKMSRELSIQYGLTANKWPFND